MSIVSTCALALGITLSSVACAESNNPENSTSLIEAEQAWLDPSDGAGDRTQTADSEQVQYAYKALASAKDVALRSGSQRANEVLAFIEQNAKPARLTSLGPVVIGNTVKLDEDDFFVLGITSQDSGINQVSDFYIPQKANGVFIYDLHTIVLYPESGLKDEWLGIIALHEGGHALNRATHANYSPNEEAATWIFQLELASGIFGEPYNQLVKKAMDDMRSAFVASINQGSPIYLPPIDVSGITKSDSSEQEKRLAHSSVLFDSFFRLMDEFGRGTLAEKQQLYDFIVPQLG